MHFDTAAICEAALSSGTASETFVGAEVAAKTLPGYEPFFAFNATRALGYFLQYFERGNGLSIDHDSWVHPVIKSELNRSNCSNQHGPKFKLWTQMNWRNGAWITPKLQPMNGYDFEIVDAVQSMGNLKQHELAMLLEENYGNRLILGALHKWVGSAAPLGFLLVPNSLFEAFPDLANYLGEVDYLGGSLLKRSWITKFPDTYLSTCSPYLSRFWNLAFHHDTNHAECLRNRIQDSYDEMRVIMEDATQLDIENEESEHRAFCRLSGTESELARVCAVLNSLNARFTIYRDMEEYDYPTSIRLSAPIGANPNKTLRTLHEALSE